MCDCEPWAFVEHKTVIARKQGKCCECRRPIVKGQTYYRIAGKCDGRVETFKTCLRCRRVIDALTKGTDVCLCIGGMREYLSTYNQDKRRTHAYAE